MNKLIQALDNVQASLDRIYRFLGCPKPSEDPEGFRFWILTHRKYNSEPCPLTQAVRRWGEVYDGGQ